MLAAIFYVLRTGVPWRDLPTGFGPWSSVYARFRRWCASGLFALVLAQLAKRAKGLFASAKSDADLADKLVALGFQPAGGSVADMKATIQRDRAKWKIVIDASNIRAE